MSSLGLAPYPTGWYSVGFSSDLAAGEVRSGSYFGRELVFFRQANGQPVAMDAHCPHMGAHMGRGGAVVDGTIRCPFHHFCFDSEGSCVSTPYKKRLPRARASVWPAMDRNGLLLCWYDEAGGPPSFDIPHLHGDGYEPFEIMTFEPLRSHPQETTENSVDLGHLAVVHGYSDIAVLKPLRTDGPYLTARYAMSRENPFVSALPKIRAEFEVHALGLGYSFVEVEVKELGLKSRHFVLPTPLDGEKIELRVASAIRLDEPRTLSKVLGALPARMARRIVSEVVFRNYVSDVRQDFIIWENKRYVQPAALAEGDGPVGPYRKWCKQFYPLLERSAAQ
jgi:nitrite reductase/ring-hydroxylating ferredoxin subunit